MATEWNGNQAIEHKSKESSARQIKLPCVTNLYFSENTLPQKVNIYNPKTNNCLISFALEIDGKLYWESGYCKPGNGYYEIELNEPLQSGNYNAKLVYNCFSLDGKQLNSAVMETNVIVGR